MPATNTAKWQEKFERNKLRDARATSALAALGWDILVIWECETRSKDFATQLARKLGMATRNPGSRSTK